MSIVTESSSTDMTAPLDAATQLRLLSLWNAQQQPNEATVRSHLSDSEETYHMPGDVGVPMWSGIARTLLSSCTFRTLVNHVEQTYNDPVVKGSRTEQCSVVLLSLLKAGYTGNSWTNVKPLTLLVSFTAFVSPSPESSVAGQRTRTAAHVTLIDDEGSEKKLVPILVVELHETSPSTSYIARGAHRQLAAALAYRTGIIATSSTAKRATEKHGMWHLALIITAARAHLGGASPVATLSGITEALYAQHIQRGAAYYAREGGVKGIAPLAFGFPLVHWHAAQDGPATPPPPPASSSSGAASSADPPLPGNNKKRKVAKEPSAATNTIVAALQSLDVMMAAAPRASTKASKQAAATTQAAIEAVAEVGGREGLSFFHETIEVPAEIFHSILLNVASKVRAAVERPPRSPSSAK